MHPRVFGGLALAGCLTLSSCSLIDEQESAATSNEATTAPDSTSSSTASTATSTTNEPAAPPPAAPIVPDLDPPLWVGLDLKLTPIAELTEPTAMAPRSGFEHLYVTERAGQVRLIERSFTKKGAERIKLSSRTVLDISEQVSVLGEGGLLGIAFTTDGRFMFVSYTDLDGDLVVEEYEVGRSTRADASTAREILRVPQPFDNHNGGQLTLGPDGFLYIGVGDGGGAYDPEGNGQDTSTLLGSVLRVDTFTAGDEPYAIPAGNPLVGQDNGLEELFLWGVRNPWRFSFDLDTGDLWLADLGQDTSEEINLLTAASGGGWGANLGWGDIEGYTLVEGGSAPADHQLPLHVYDHGNGRCSVTGGFVYRGSLVPALDGAYIFGDYCSGEIIGLHHQDGFANTWAFDIATPANALASFGQGFDGEIYVLQLDGQVLRIEMADAEDADQ